MMAGNPNLWSMNNGMHPQSHHRLSSSNPDHHHLHPNGPVSSWTQLFLGGLNNINEEEAFGANVFQQQMVENWQDHQVLNLNPILLSSNFTRLVDVKQEVSSSQFYGQNIDYINEFIIDQPNSHHHQALPVSSPASCITTLIRNNIFNFSGEESKNQHHNQDHSSECNSTGAGGTSKKARVTQSSAQPPLKVRKEKLGDRITALHQLVSPFGKTDTSSVLSEVIGYIRFLQAQIKALSTPYMRNAPGSTRHHQLTVQEGNCLFPHEPAQDPEGRSGPKDLRSRGLCLVPISCTQHFGNEDSADYWVPTAFGGGF